MTHNLSQCQTLMSKAISAGAKALFLPEASDYIAPSPPETLSLCLPPTTSPFILGLQSLARSSSIPINVGVHEPTNPPSNRVRNTLLWINDRGEIVHRYQKMHVFDVDLRDVGGPWIRESESTEPGKGMVDELFELPEEELGGGAGGGRKVKIGSQICFDVRFAEMGIRLRRLGADVLLYPSAFTVPTGKLHWEVLLRARAIENQCWVVAAAQCGRHNGRRVSYGESMVVDPDGRVRGRLDGVEDMEGEKEGAREPGLLVVDVEMGVVERVRRGMVLRRRGDVYPEL